MGLELQSKKTRLETDQPCRRPLHRLSDSGSRPTEANPKTAWLHLLRSKDETFKRRVKSHLPSADIIRSSPYAPHQEGKGEGIKAHRNVGNY
jgi:hypothetical protein